MSAIPFGGQFWIISKSGFPDKELGFSLETRYTPTAYFWLKKCQRS